MKKNKKKLKNDINKRLNILKVIIYLSFIVILLQIFNISILNNTYYNKL